MTDRATREEEPGAACRDADRSSHSCRHPRPTRRVFARWRRIAVVRARVPRRTRVSDRRGVHRASLVRGVPPCVSAPKAAAARRSRRRRCRARSSRDPRAVRDVRTVADAHRDARRRVPDASRPRGVDDVRVRVAIREKDLDLSYRWFKVERRGAGRRDGSRRDSTRVSRRVSRDDRVRARRAHDDGEGRRRRGGGGGGGAARASARFELRARSFRDRSRDERDLDARARRAPRVPRARVPGRARTRHARVRVDGIDGIYGVDGVCGVDGSGRSRRSDSSESSSAPGNPVPRAR